MDATKRFDGLADVYTKSRPGYAAAFIDCLYEKHGITSSSVIADIGSGTGKFSKHLLEKGSVVYGVEPNEDMRRIAERELMKYEQFHSVEGSAEATALEEDFADCVTVAQAFHWFDVENFKKECIRILKKDGKVFLIWNIRNEAAALNAESHQIFSKYCPEFRGFNGGMKRDDERIRKFFNGRYEYISYENPLYFDRERFIERNLSSSYSLKAGDAEYEEYIRDLNALFDRYAQNGVVEVENRTVAYIGTLG